MTPKPKVGQVWRYRIHTEGDIEYFRIEKVFQRETGKWVVSLICIPSVGAEYPGANEYNADNFYRKDIWELVSDENEERGTIEI